MGECQHGDVHKFPQIHLCVDQRPLNVICIIMYTPKNIAIIQPDAMESLLYKNQGIDKVDHKLHGIFEFAKSCTIARSILGLPSVKIDYAELAVRGPSTFFV